MEKNVCGVDRLVRAVLLVLLVVRLVRSRRGTVDEWSVSGPDLLTAYAIAELSINVFVQWCPANALLDINTCRRD